MPSDAAAVSSSRIAFSVRPPRRLHDPPEPGVGQARRGQHDAEVEDVAGERAVGEIGGRVGNTNETEGPAGQVLPVEGDELDGDRDAEGRDRQVLLAQPQGGDPDHRGRRPGRGHAAGEPHHEGQLEPARDRLARGPDQDRGGVAADRHEARDTGVEEPRVPPLQVEPQHRDPEHQGDDQEEHEVGDDAGHRGSPNSPWGRKYRTARISRNGTAGL